jgi:DNA-binding transcriptional LysR family regulator
MNLRSVDLNLLVAFDALLQHRHVTRAGKSIGLSQSAMSNALSRLRVMFDNQLLVRAGPNMDPTPRAMELHGPIRQALAQIDASLNQESSFIPSTVHQTVRLAISEDEAVLFLPRLQTRLSAVAPGIDLSVRGLANSSPVDLLTNGECDIAMGRLNPSMPTPPYIRRQDLLTQRFACMARRGHPAFDGPLSIEKYLAFPHIQVTPMGRATSIVDDKLAQLGLERRIAVSVSLSMVAPFLLAGTDLIANLPERLAASVAPMLDVEVRELPIEIDPLVTSLGWHKRNDDDEGHRWFRNLICELNS